MHNKKLVDRYCPQWSKTLTSGTPTNKEDGLIMADVEGADAVNLDRALVAPTLEVKMYCTVFGIIAGRNAAAGK